MIYEFDRFRLDAGSLMLYRDGQEVSLPPKVIETLVVLIENHGEIVGKDELMDKVWSDSIVEESNLSQYIYQLRKTLGNRADSKPFIETFRRRGYRFNGEVKEISPFTAIKSQKVKSPIQSAAGYEVERHGNVLKLVDWKPAESESAEDELSENAPSVKPEASQIPQRSVVSSNLIIGIAAVGALIFAIFYFRQQFFSSAQMQTAAKNEITFLHLTNGIMPHYATISPDGKYFTYHEQDGEVSHLFVQQTGQISRQKILPDSEMNIFIKAFSPDSQFIYFVARAKGEMKHILYRVPTLGGLQTKITENIDSAPSFSPDGKEMVFSRWNPESGESALVIAASDGTGTERILLERGRGQEVVTNPAWSPDGETIAFAAMYPQGSQTPFSKINKISLKTGEINALSPDIWDVCYRIAWMRDGQGLVFIGTKSGEGLSTRLDQVFYLSVSNGETRRLTTDGNRYHMASLGVTDDDAIIVVPNSRQSQIWQMSPDGDSRSAIQITYGSADGRAGLAPLPDGRVGYITRTGENLHVWTMNSDGTNPKQLTTEPSLIEELRASPDGSYFVFSANRENQNQFFRIDADGTNLRQLTFAEGTQVDSTISPDGNWIVFDSKFFDGSIAKYALLKIPGAGGESVRVSETDCAIPHFSPDGKFISCIRADHKILILSAETGEIVKTFETTAAYLNTGAHWTRDGQNLVYRVNRQNVTNLWIQPVNGGAARQLTDFTVNGVHNFAYSTDGSRLYAVRAYQINDALLITNFR